MLQAIINVLYRYPLSYLKRVNSMGGILSYRSMKQGQRQMRSAAFKLSPVHSSANGLPVYFLTGKNYLYQTLFCITSLTKCSAEQFKFILIDDGSFDEKLISLIKRQLPGAAIIQKQSIEDNIQTALPANKYPVLNHKRAEYAHIKKLTDVHTLPGKDWKLVLDSDMLFWGEPTQLIAWLKNSSKPVHMVDCTESYGYPIALMEQLASAKIPALLNVGVIGLQSSSICWQELEDWTATLETQEGKTYYLEQALSAMLVAKQTCLILDKQDYIVNPGDDAVSHNKGILHHYVDQSKKAYYTTAWKKLI
ncbi:hypothetical protein [Mucilaginibacter sp. HD30]